MNVPSLIVTILLHRGATQRGFAVMKEEVEKMRAAAQQPQQDKKSWEILFGTKQFEKR